MGRGWLVDDFGDEEEVKVEKDHDVKDAVQKKEETPDKSDQTPPWSCLMILFILANFWWWFMFGKPFLDLFTRLIAAIEKIANM